MTTATNPFWTHFNNHRLSQAVIEFDNLNKEEKQNVMSVLFQKSEFHRKPVMISILRRHLHDNKTFDDFHQSWLPDDGMCHKIQSSDATYLQHFPVPVRVFNAVNANNSKEIFSIGITWVANETEEQELWKHTQQTIQGENKNNNTRHDKIKEVADGELLGLFQVITDDYLGTPFS